MTNPINPRDPVHRRVLALQLAAQVVGPGFTTARYVQQADEFVAYIEHGELASD